MKKSLLLSITMLSLTTISLTFAAGMGNGQGKGQGQNFVEFNQQKNDPQMEIGELPMEELSEAETLGLLQMREEEKLARDVYLTLHDKWGVQIFSNIAASEQQHTDSVKALLDKYSITDPVTDDSIGVFNDQELQNLYNDLVAQGSESETASLQVGATIEDLDIYDLKVFLAETDNEDITKVYENLTRGSRNHLRSFTRQLEKNGEIYSAQYLSQEEVDEIINSEQEKGNYQMGQNGDGGHGYGQGKGKGNGKGQGYEQGKRAWQEDGEVGKKMNLKLGDDEDNSKGKIKSNNRKSWWKNLFSGWFSRWGK